MRHLAGLCMRFVLGFLMPLAIPVHLAVGVAGFRALLRSGDDSVNSFDDPKVMTKIPISFKRNYCMARRML